MEEFRSRSELSDVRTGRLMLISLLIILLILLIIAFSLSHTLSQRQRVKNLAPRKKLQRERETELMKQKKSCE